MAPRASQTLQGPQPPSAPISPPLAAQALAGLQAEHVCVQYVAAAMGASQRLPRSSVSVLALAVETPLWAKADAAVLREG